jgi:hypothetical protein
MGAEGYRMPCSGIAVRWELAIVSRSISVHKPIKKP